jgi:hypothetical protein
MRKFIFGLLFGIGWILLTFLVEGSFWMYLPGIVLAVLCLMLAGNFDSDADRSGGIDGGV